MREKDGDLVVTLETKDGLIGDNVPVGGIKLAPELALLVDSTRIAVTPGSVPAGESNIRTVTLTEDQHSYELKDVPMGTLVKEHRERKAKDTGSQS